MASVLPLQAAAPGAVEETRPRLFLKVTIFRAFTWTIILLFAAVKFRFSERPESRIDFVAAVAAFMYVSSFSVARIYAEYRP